MLDIESGKLGLPDLQRPFVWQNAKVRELFDSMMKGYPIGYLMLWDAPEGEGNDKQIGIGMHSHEAPKQLIIDGQQRLTSLFSVMSGKKVLDSRFQERPISIAFNPLQRKFEVTNASHHKSAEWIAEISEVYQNANNSFSYIGNYIQKLEDARKKDSLELTSEEKQTVATNIQDLLQLKDYMIPTLSITDQADEEDVADIFVRVNSGGKSLNENDFILTLISVHDEEERRRIEKFCKDATIPVAGGSSYNQLFTPKPSHIIRVVMAYGFKRARLHYAYLLLRGKNMDTGIFELDLRDAKFQELEKRLDEVLNLNNWHEFINCVISAGYLSSSLIAAENALVYTYVMYLIGKYDFKVNAVTLRKTIARWFYMTSVSSYYTVSYETQVQSDLNNLKSLQGAEAFQNYLYTKIDAVFTNDYFDITLPAGFATSAAISPAWNAYCAAQNVLDMKAMFSTMPVRGLFSPGAGGTKSAVEKHHLFPKAYLSRIGIDDDRDRNQIANFAFIEWKDNISISDDAPNKYWPKVTSGIESVALRQMLQDNALPQDWASMSYSDFLEARQKLMASIVRRGYEKLSGI